MDYYPVSWSFRSKQTYDSIPAKLYLFAQSHGGEMTNAVVSKSLLIDRQNSTEFFAKTWLVSFLRRLQFVQTYYFHSATNLVKIISWDIVEFYGR